MIGLKNLIRSIYYWSESIIFKLLEILIPSKINDYRNVPIIINNRNRLTFLLLLISSLEKRGYKKIYIIDNDSTYPPLLEYYKQTTNKVIYLNKNLGYLALWKSNIYKSFIRDFYVYTDPDMVPVEECPADFLNYFLKILKEHKFAKKVGFSLKIDDLPDHYKNKEKVMSWEFNFFKHKTPDGLYKAPIDTTFALYRPWAKGGSNDSHLTLRTPFPYEARHLPWYQNSSDLSEEEIYYIEHANQSTFWTKDS